MLTFEDTLKVMVHLAYAVHHLHQLNITHNDLKASNILIDEKQLPVIADFGLSMVGRNIHDCRGTPSHQAPEMSRHHRQPK